MKFNHVSVLKEQCIQALDVKSGGVYFDGTLGGGGHSYEILKRSGPDGRLVATDLDEDALAAAKERLKDFGDRFIPVHANFKKVKEILNDLKIDKLDGALLDLGVSSYQLDNRDRGFSYMAPEAALDMRMDKGQKFSAYDVINGYSEEELKKILYEYGEERFSSRIAADIVRRRAVKPLETAGELIEVLEESIPKKFRSEGHIAKRTFQALRIEVNGELKGLRECVFDLASCLKSGGRLAVITFHSLEDRIVKQAFKELESDCVCPKSFPVCVCGKKREIEILTKKPITADENELKLNSRAKSAKLRIAGKL